MMNERTAFEYYLDLEDDNERGDYLEKLSNENPDLHDRVVALLRSHDEAGSFLQDAPVDELDTVVFSVPHEPGTQIDRYKVREKIGEGGFGTVYVAEQIEPVRRKVALKVIKPGMDSRQVIARFEAERQTLALLNHPNIATVLDAGQTDSGHPYFVMELVAGRPITKFCDEHQLTVVQRLQLFVDLCRAVQHAHHKGIIHRDLKPSNVLVTKHDDNPVVKVIDFGVSKALNSNELTDATIYTAYGQMLGTPMYMSPEQAQLSGLDIDTRSDVYSLGVLMYELLTGTTPVERERFRKTHGDAMRRLICEEEPVRPSVRVSTIDAKRDSTASKRRSHEASSLAQSYRGELDWIAMKALEKNRNRRYDSSNALASDVERYLNNEPVLARPPSSWYRLRKFAQRRKSALVVASLAAVIILTVAGSVGWIANDRVSRRARAAEQIGHLVDEAERLILAERWDESRATLQRAKTLMNSEAVTPTLNRQLDQLASDLDFVRQLDAARLVQSRWEDDGFDYTGSDRAYAMAFKESEVDVRQVDPAEAAKKLSLRPLILPRIVSALDHWAQVNLKVDDSKIEAAKKLVTISQQLDKDSIRSQLREAMVTEDAAILDRILEASSDIAFLKAQPLQSIFLLSDALYEADRQDQAIKILRQAQRYYPSDFFLNYRLAHRIRERDQEDPDAIRYYSAALASAPDNVAVMNNLGLALRDQGRPDEAIALFKRAIEVDPSFGKGIFSLAKSIQSQGNTEDAIALCRRAIDDGVESTLLFNQLGLLLFERGEVDEAIPLFQKAKELDPEDVDCIALLGAANGAKGNLDEAVDLMRKVIAIDPERVDVHFNLANALDLRGDDEAASEAYRKAAELASKSTETESKYASWYINWGLLLKDMGDFEEAISVYRKAIEVDPKSAGHVNLGMVLKHQLGLEKEALEAYRRGVDADAAFLYAIHDQLARLLLWPEDDSLRNVDQAVIHAREAVRLKPESSDLYWVLGRALDAAGFPDDEVIQAYRNGLDQPAGPKWELHFQLAEKLLNPEDQSLLDPGQAVIHGRESVRLKPESSNPYLLLARALDAAGNRDREVIETYRAGLEKTKEFKGALHDQLARKLANCDDVSLRDPAQAIVHAKEAIELAPNTGGEAYATVSLGMACYRAGQWADSVEALEKASKLRRGHEAAWLKLFLAMAYWQSGQQEKGRSFFDGAVERLRKSGNEDPALLRLFAETKRLLGVGNVSTGQEEPDEPTTSDGLSG